MYGARRQIERLFKRIKQLVQPTRLGEVTQASAEAVIRALLVGRVLQEAEAAELKQVLARAASAGPRTLPGQLPDAQAVVSSWVVSRLMMETLRGTWNKARVRACVQRL